MSKPMPGILATLLLIGANVASLPLAAPAEAQYRAPQVYNPQRYNNNRALMNHRAAARAAELRRYCRTHPRASRCIALKAKQRR